MSEQLDALPKPLECLLLGYGAVGILYSYILEQSGVARVTAVARSNYEAVRNGLTLKSEKFGVIENFKPHRVCPSAEQAADRTYDFIIAAFKTLPDVTPTKEFLASFLPTEACRPESAETLPTVVLLQNGIGIEEELQREYPSINILSTGIWIAANAHSGSPYIVTHGKLERLPIGLYKGESNSKQQRPHHLLEKGNQALNTFVDALRKGGSQVTF